MGSMATFPFVALPEVFTGNVATVNDPFNTALFNNGARMALGTRFYQNDASNRRLKFAYVRLNSTTPPTLVVGPVYWKDNTFTIVTAVSAESLYGINSCAGLLLNASATNGNYVMIQTFGHRAAVPSPAATAAGDCIICAAGASQTMARVAASTAPTNTVLAVAETALSGGNSDLLIVVEDQGF